MCTPIANCTSVSCTTTTNEVCTACTTGYYVSGGVCAPCSAGACPSGQYQTAACTANADRVCTNCTSVFGCMSTTCTTATNQTCTACSPGYTLVSNSNTCRPSVAFATAAQSVNEDAGTASVVLTLSAPSNVTVTVPFTLSGSASTLDYTLPAGNIVIDAGALMTTRTFPIINDSLYEPTETLTLTLGASPTNATLGMPSAHTLSIVDDDWVKAVPTCTQGGDTQAHITRLNCTVGGTAVASYSYKFGPDMTTVCSDPAGYSADTALTTPILQNFSRVADGTTMRLCIVAADAARKWQPYTDATTRTWVKNPQVPSILFLNLYDQLPATMVVSGPSTFGIGYSISCDSTCLLEVNQSGVFSTTVSTATSTDQVRVQTMTAPTPATETTSVVSYASPNTSGTVRFYTRTRDATPCGMGTKRVFITGEATTGDLGGVSGADAFCQASATQAGLVGTWQAFLGSAGRGAALNQITAGDYCDAFTNRVILSGRAFVGAFVQFSDGIATNGAYSRETYAPNAARYGSNRESGGFWYGQTDTLCTCNEWTSAATTAACSSAGTARWSSLTFLDTNWKYFQLMTGGSGITSCATPMHLVCFEL